MSGLYDTLLRWLGPPVRLYSRVQVIGRENLPPVGQPVMLAANHPGSLWWDAFCLASALQVRRLRFVAAYWDASNPFLAPILNRVDALYLGESLDAITDQDPIVQALRNGESVCFFPEQSYHTFRWRYTVFQFAAQIAKYAHLSGAPIVPTAVIGVEEASPTLFGWKRRGMPFHITPAPIILPWKVTLEFGKPTSFAELAGSVSSPDADTYVEAARQMQLRLGDLIRSHRPRCTVSDKNYLDHAGWR